MIFDTFSDIKIDVVPLNNIKSEVTSCIALLKNTTGVCITRNILSQLSANAEEDEEESTDIWVGISVNVQKEQNDELSRRQNTTLHFSQNVLGLIGIAHITSSQSDLKEVKKKFNILKEQQKPVTESYLICIKDKGVDLDSEDSNLVFIINDRHNIRCELENQLVKIVYFIMLKMQTMLEEEGKYKIELSDEHPENAFSSIFKKSTVKTTVQQNSTKNLQKSKLASGINEDDVLDEGKRALKLSGDILLLLGLPTFAAKNYTNILISDKKKLNPFWLASSLECLCCCYLMHMIKKYEIWPSKGSIRDVENTRPQMKICSDVLSLKKIIESAKLYYDIASFMWNLTDIYRNILRNYQEVQDPMYHTYSLVHAANLSINIAYVILAAGEYELDKKFVNGTSLSGYAHNGYTIPSRHKPNVFTTQKRPSKTDYYLYNPNKGDQTLSHNIVFRVSPPFSSPDFLSVTGNAKYNVNDPFAILKLTEPPEKNREPCTIKNDAATWIENIYTCLLYNIPQFERKKLERKILAFYAKVDFKHKKLVFLYEMLKRNLGHFFLNNFLQLPDGRLERLKSPKKSNYYMELAWQSFKYAQLMHNILLVHYNDATSKKSPLLFSIAKTLTFFAAYTNQFSLAAELCILILDKHFLDLSWKAKDYYLKAFCTYSLMGPVNTVKILGYPNYYYITDKNEKGENDGGYYASIFGNIKIKSINVSGITERKHLKTFDNLKKASSISNPNLSICDPMKQCKYYTSVNKTFYLDLDIENGFMLNMEIRKVEVRTNAKSIETLSPFIRLPPLSVTRVLIPITPLEKGVLTLEAIIFTLLGDGLECEIPIIDIDISPQAITKILVYPQFPLLSIDSAKSDASEGATVTEGNIKTIKLHLNNIGHVPADVKCSFIPRKKECNNSSNFLGTVYKLFENNCVALSIEKGSADSVEVQQMSAEDIFESASSQKSICFKIPAQGSTQMLLNIFGGYKGEIEGEIQLLYHPIIEEEDHFEYDDILVMHIPIMVYVEKGLEVKAIKILNSDLPLFSKGYYENLGKMLNLSYFFQNTPVPGREPDFFVALFYFKNSTNKKLKINISTINDKKELESKCEGIFLPHEEKCIPLFLEKTDISWSLFESDIPASLRHFFVPKLSKADSNDMSNNQSHAFWLSMYLMSDFCQIAKGRCNMMKETDPRQKLILGRIKSSLEMEGGTKGMIIMSSVPLVNVSGCSNISRCPITISCNTAPCRMLNFNVTDDSITSLTNVTDDSIIPLTNVWELVPHKFYTLEIKIELSSLTIFTPNTFFLILLETKPSPLTNILKKFKNLPIVIFRGAMKAIYPAISRNSCLVHTVDVIGISCGKIKLDIFVRRLDKSVFTDMNAEALSMDITNASSKWFALRGVEIVVR